MFRTLRCLCCLMLLLAMTRSSFAADMPLPKPAAEAIRKFDEAVDDAREVILKALDDQIDATAKTGNLAEVRVLRTDKENFEKTGAIPKSMRLKTAVTKSRTMIKGAFERTKIALDAAVKEHTKAKDFETAEQIQKALESHVKTWSEVASGTRSSFGPAKVVAATTPEPKQVTTPTSEPSKTTTPMPNAGDSKSKPTGESAFTVITATWGMNELLRPNLARQDVKEKFSKLLAAGTEFTVNSATFGEVEAASQAMGFAPKAINVELQVEKQILRLWIGHESKVKLGTGEKSNADVWEGGPLQLVSATWQLDDGSRATDVLGRLKELLKTKGKAVAGTGDFGELQFLKSKVMQLQLQAKQSTLSLRITEHSKIEVVPAK